MSWIKITSGHVFTAIFVLIAVTGFIAGAIGPPLSKGAETKIECHKLLPMFQLVASLQPYLADTDVKKTLDDVYRECNFTPESFTTVRR